MSIVESAYEPVFYGFGMPQLSTLEYVADLVIRRVAAELPPGADLRRTLEREYPFEDNPRARRIWMEALSRNGFSLYP